MSIWAYSVGMVSNYYLYGAPRWLAIVVIIVVLWEAIWKGVALWHAGSDRNLLWFVLIFVLNTAGILEIIYIFGISRPRRARAAAAAAAGTTGS